MIDTSRISLGDLYYGQFGHDGFGSKKALGIR
jgi:hypothetical protein